MSLNTSVSLYPPNQIGIFIDHCFFPTSVSLLRLLIMEAAAVSWTDLPEGCIAHVLSFTSPLETCRLSLVSRTFHSATQSDALWDSFLPTDYPSILSLLSSSFSFSSKKHLYLLLSDKPLLIDNRLKSFLLDRMCGKKCYMLSASSLTNVSADDQRYWRWTSVPEARFEEVVELSDDCVPEMEGRINTLMLSPSTLYAAYLVFKSPADVSRFKHEAVDVSISIAENDSRTQQQRIFVPKTTKRADGWLEIELGDFYNEGGDDKEQEMAVIWIRLVSYWDKGLIIQGFEIRPKLH